MCFNLCLFRVKLVINFGEMKNSARVQSLLFRVAVLALHVAQSIPQQAIKFCIEGSLFNLYYLKFLVRKLIIVEAYTESCAGFSKDSVIK